MGIRRVSADTRAARRVVAFPHDFHVVLQEAGVRVAIEGPRGTVEKRASVVAKKRAEVL